MQKKRKENGRERKEREGGKMRKGEGGSWEGGGY